jgi:cation diffusion facilitator CzcD-associated flavoprotein CzcO
MVNDTSYQILIIGGGAAGITVASQLITINQDGH